MKVLWITNIPFGKMRQLAGLDHREAGGSWLDATINEFIGDENVSICVATTWKTDSIKTVEEQNVTYCLMPGGEPYQYNHKSLYNRRTWEELKSYFQPDIINVWGTEFTHGYLALQVFHDIPAVIYMQGLLSSLSRFYLSGLTNMELLKSITIRDLLKMDLLYLVKLKYAFRAKLETEMICLAKNVIVENLWCASKCMAISNECKIHYCNLIIQEEFFKHTWDSKLFKKRTIMCNAANYPIKGLHILIKAMNIIVRDFPETIVYVPGLPSPFDLKGIEKIKVRGYIKIIKSLINKYSLENNFQFIGQLTPSGMASKMAEVNVFVMPSSIENHSSTLIEAMAVGTPCISSNVGGIPEYFNHGEDGFLYRFEEYELLAAYIKLLFDDTALAEQFGKRARLKMIETRKNYQISEKMKTIYSNILSPK